MTGDWMDEIMCLNYSILYKYSILDMIYVAFVMKYQWEQQSALHKNSK